MKHAKKIFALALALVMVMALGVAAFAADAPSITIENSAKGETYKVYKLFDATVADDGTIAYYTENFPAELEEFGFEWNESTHYITAAPATISDELVAVLKTLATDANKVAEATGTGAALKIDLDDYGYYVVTSSQGGGAAISVDATNPTASMYDKNVTEPSMGGGTEGVSGKAVDKDNISIGDTVTYTITFTTSNYAGAGEDAKLIRAYFVTDTLPSFLDRDTVTVTSITVNGEEPNEFKGLQFSARGVLTLPWVDTNGTEEYTADDFSRFENGATVVITYTATVSTEAAIVEDNTNTATVTYKTSNGDDMVTVGTGEATIHTYALAIQKVDGEGNHLPGATFSIAGVSAEKNEDGSYTVTSTNADEATVMECNEDGYLVVYGLAAADDYELTEEKAPDGYNKLAEAETVKVTRIASLDDLVEIEIENQAGALLPSTGGIGTTIFYVVGGVLVAAAVVLLITKKRMSAKG